MIPHKLAHKLQNLLTVVMGYLDLGVAALAEDDEEAAAAYFERTRNTIREISMLIGSNVQRNRD